MEKNKILVDSNVFIAIFNQDDALHKKAIALWELLQKEGYRVVVSNFIIGEVITVLSQKVGKDLAMDFALTMYDAEDRETEIIRMDEEGERMALEFLKKIPSKNVSFVDATLLAILELYKIRELASFDKIFRQQKWIKLVS